MAYPTLISYKEALELLESLPLTPLGTQRVHFKNALNRICAQEIKAPCNVPAYPTAAMDGYAINFDDMALLESDGLEISQINKAGNPTRPTLTKGCAIKAFTGSIMPHNADTLVIVEHIEIRENRIFLNIQAHKDFIHKAHWVRQVGDNYKQGEVLLHKGDKIGAFEIGLLAELNCNFIQVYQKVRVGIICVGDEIIEVGEISENANIVRSVNTHLLESLLLQMGQEPIVYPLLKDDKDKIKSTYQSALQECDMVVSAGGMSMGDYDFTQVVITECADMVFKGVRLKPGKPVACALYSGRKSIDLESMQNLKNADSLKSTQEGQDSKTIENTRVLERAKPILGLPGFPNSCALTFLLFGSVLLARLQNRIHKPYIFEATLLEDIKRSDSRLEFRACEIHNNNGILQVSFKNKKSLQSSMINNLTHNTAVAILEENGSDLKAGAKLKVMFLNHF